MRYNMMDYDNWVYWKKTWDPAEGKYKKQPMNPLKPGEMAKSNTPSTWASWSIVRAQWDIREMLCRDWDGIGYVFSNDDPFIFLDIDGREVDPIGFDDGAFIERSVSGNGYHIITVGRRPETGFYKKLGSYEAYDQGRFVALTFDTISGSLSNLSNNQFGVDLFCTMHLTKSKGGGKSTEKYDHDDIPWDKGPEPEWDGPEDDDALIELMLTDMHYNAGRKHLVGLLWNRDEQALMDADGRFVKSEDNTFDWSRADLSLMNALADFTGDDPERMDRLFRRSALFREKRWNTNYQTRTIAAALNRDEKYRRIYRPVSPQTIVTPVVTTEVFDMWQHTSRFTSDLLTIQEQEELFKGCVYVQDRNEIFTPDGSFMKQDSFKSSMYAGHLFIIDPHGKTVVNAWEAFTQNRAIKFPKVMSTCFRPDKPPGVIGGVLNTYVPAQTRRMKGDVSRFTGHLEKMFPNEQDRAIITNFMAAVVQYPGIKFQWCPVIQGTEGNGKSMLIRAITHAIGERYCHSVNSNALADGGGKFNKWLENKLFIDFEEIYTADRRDMMEILKPIVTNPRMEIQAKGANQYTGDNRANMIMATNHKDAVIKTSKDRRYAILYTAQQDAADCIRDGMTNEYFSSIYDWLNEDGYAMVAEWLHTYPIRADMNPAKGCQRAPETSCSQEAIIQSLSVVEQYIMEWVDTGRAGFRGGWISSAKLDEALREVGMGSRVAPNRRKAMLESLGYGMHPGLAEGKSPVELMAEGGKRPRLYVKQSNTILTGLTDKNVICEMYCKAQNYA